jgi:alpha-tubulin suppressor-like RCC1 family protein
MFAPLKKEQIAQIAAGSDHSCILTRTYQLFVISFMLILCL